jgi:RNA polymerase sigma factor (TIGR02999 family)
MEPHASVPDSEGRQSAGIEADRIENLLPGIYKRLRRIAALVLKSQAPDFTLGATDLVHEALLKLCGPGVGEWKDPGHFYRVAAAAVRQALVDHARRRNSLKRGGWTTVEALDGQEVALLPNEDQIIRLDEWLEDLGRADPRKAQVVQLRFFAGLTMKEIAGVLEVSIPTVERDCRTGLAWLAAKLKETGDGVRHRV